LEHKKLLKVAPTVIVSTTTTTTEPYLGVTQSDIEAWSKVSMCEEGGNWNIQGPVYSGGLGMLNSTWIAYGGLAYAPNAGLASMVQQIAVAKRIQANPPDQYGCSGAW